MCLICRDPPLRFMGLSVSKFVPTDSYKSLLNFFKPRRTTECTTHNLNESSSANPNSASEISTIKKTEIDGEIPTIFMDYSSTCADDDGRSKYCRRSDYQSSENTTISVKFSAIVDYHDSFFCGHFENKKILPLNVTQKLTFDADVESRLLNLPNVYSASEKRNPNSDSVTVADRDYDQIIENGASIHNVKNNHDSRNRQLQERNRLLNRVDENDETNDAISDVLTKSGSGEYCNFCQQSIALEDLPVHLDYHAACELQEQLNISATCATDERFSKSNCDFDYIASSKAAGKYRTKNSSESRFTPMAKGRTITSFFSTKPQTT